MTEALTDRIDRAIAAAVARDGRATLADLAATAGLSVSATQARLRRLEARGAITGYRAIVDPAASGTPLAAFIEITPLDPAQKDDAPAALEPITAIESCHSIAGDASYMLFVRVASPRELERVINAVRAAAAVNTRTTVVLQTFFENRPTIEV